MAHARVGQDGQPLWVHEIPHHVGCLPSFSPRNMHLVEYIAESNCPVKVVRDPRVTSPSRSSAGRFHRRTATTDSRRARRDVAGGPRPITAVELQEHYGPLCTGDPGSASGPHWLVANHGPQSLELSTAAAARPVSGPSLLRAFIPARDLADDSARAERQGCVVSSVSHASNKVISCARRPLLI